MDASGDPRRTPAGSGPDVEHSTPSRLEVPPGAQLRGGTFVAPGDKSVTHRAYLLGGLARGETVVENRNTGADCDSTLACLRQLGVMASVLPSGAVTITGSDMRLRAPDGVLDCGNSGTTLRLLAGILAGQDLEATLTGDESLRSRPVARIIEPLRRMGARLSAEGGDRLPPLTVSGASLRPIDYALPMASAQVASCVLLAGLQAQGTTMVRVPGPARDHTERMLPVFGVALDRGGPDSAGATTTAVSGPARLTGVRMRVPGDFSAAAFFLAGAAASPGTSVSVDHVSLNPTRTGLLDVLERMGARVERSGEHLECGEPVGRVTVTGPDTLRAADIAPSLVPAMVDEIPAWAVAASAARGTSRVSGAGELRVKESDRLAALASTLGRLGVAVAEYPDGLAITGGRIGGGEVDAAGDHRIAMALAVIATRASGRVSIAGAEGIPTSFPGFRDTLAALTGGAFPA